MNRQPRILLFGKNGQLGTALQKQLPTLGRVIAPDRATCDIARMDILSDFIDSVQPTIIVNAAGYTHVDKAECETKLADQLNAQAPMIMAQSAHRCNALLVHYSTDYVFDGTKLGTYHELDHPNPLNNYGKSKLKGDQLIMQTMPHYLILRVGWLFSAQGSRFFNNILRLSKQQSAIKVVDDQWGSPTSVDIVVDATTQVLTHFLQSPTHFAYGLYHLSARGTTNRYGYAKAIVESTRANGWLLKCLPKSIQPIATEVTTEQAIRPLNTCLDTQHIRNTFNLTLPMWQEGIDKTVRALSRQASL